MTYPPPPPGYVAPAPGPQPHGRPPARSVWWKSIWFVAIVAAVVGIGIGAASAGGGAKKDAATAPTVTATATTTVTETATVNATVTARPVITKVVQTKTRTQTETYTPAPKPSFDDGTYEVGADIDAGTFRTDGGASCYYAVLKDIDGGLDNIVQNNNFSGPSLVKVEDGQYFEVSGGCEWRHK